MWSITLSKLNKKTRWVNNCREVKNCANTTHLVGYIRHLKRVIQLHRVYLLVILESFILQYKFEYIRWYLFFNANKIQIFKNVGTIVIDDHPLFLHVRVEDLRIAWPIYLTSVYTSYDLVVREELWAGHHHIFLDIDYHWLVGKDFNVIAHDGERTDHKTRDRGITTFSNWMMDYGRMMLVSFGYNRRRQDSWRYSLIQQLQIFINSLLWGIWFGHLLITSFSSIVDLWWWVGAKPFVSSIYDQVLWFFSLHLLEVITFTHLMRMTTLQEKFFRGVT